MESKANGLGRGSDPIKCMGFGDEPANNLSKSMFLQMRFWAYFYAYVNVQSLKWAVDYTDH